MTDICLTGDYYDDNNSSDQPHYDDRQDQSFFDREVISPMPPTPSSSSRYYPETNEFPPPPGHWYDQSNAEHFYPQPPQQVQDQQQVPEQAPYHPADYAGLAPTRPQPEAYNPAEYAAGMAGQPSQDYFQPLPQQYDYQPEQPASPQDYRPNNEPEAQQGPMTYLNYAGLQDGHQSTPQSEYKTGPHPYQQPIEHMPAGPYENARGGGGGSDGDDVGTSDGDDVGTGDGNRDGAVTDRRDDVEEENRRRSDDDVSVPPLSEGYTRGGDLIIVSFFFPFFQFLFCSFNFAISGIFEKRL